MGDRTARAGAKARGGRGKKRPRAPGLAKLSKDVVRDARADLEEALKRLREIKVSMERVTDASLKRAEGTRLDVEEESFDEDSVVKRLKELNTFWEARRRSAVKYLGLLQESRAEASQGDEAARKAGAKSLMDSLRPSGDAQPTGRGAAG